MQAGGVIVPLNHRLGLNEIIAQTNDCSPQIIVLGAEFVEFKEVLLELKVTPTITQDGRVFLDLGVKKDEIKDFLSTPTGDVPQIQKREVSTAVLVDDGQTVVIGGVYEFKNRDDVSKVPFLGDIPFLGALFKKSSKDLEKAELLIFVTPHILKPAPRVN